MIITFAGIFGGWEIVLILAVVLILFGAKTRRKYEQNLMDCARTVGVVLTLIRFKL